MTKPDVNHDSKDYEIEMSKRSHRLDDGSFLSLLVDSDHDAKVETIQDNPYDYLKTFACMIWYTFAWSVWHILMRYIYLRTPELNGFDSSSFSGYVLVIIYYCIGKYNGNNMNIFSYDIKVQKAMLARLIIGGLLMFFATNGFKYISVSKGVLIYSLNPLFWAIAAAMFLNERLGIVSVVSTLGAFIGIYLLTSNKADGETEKSYELLGAILELFAAIFGGILYVWLRQLNLYQIPLVLSPFYFGVSMIFQTVIVMIFQPSLLHFELYDSTNLIILFCIGMSTVFIQISLNLASRYSMASKIAPISYLENVFTLLADVWLFSYLFVTTDILGMIIIVVCLAIPIILKLTGYKV